MPGPSPHRERSLLAGDFCGSGRPPTGNSRRDPSRLVQPLVYSQFHCSKSRRNSRSSTQEDRTDQAGRSLRSRSVSPQQPGCPGLGQASKRLRCEPHPVPESFYPAAPFHRWHGTGNHREASKPSFASGRRREAVWGLSIVTKRIRSFSWILSSLAPLDAFTISSHPDAERGICFFVTDTRIHFLCVHHVKQVPRDLYGNNKCLRCRVFQHKTARISGFTQKYRVHRLVYFESWKYVRSAIAREKEIKRWTRKRRVELIELINPTWEDLAATWFTAEELAADPNAPMTMRYDPDKVQSFGGKPHQ